MKLKDVLATVVIIGIVIVSILSVIKGMEANQHTGPSALVDDKQNNIYINLGATIYKLDRQGSLIDEANLEQLGLPPDIIADIQTLNNGKLIIVLSHPTRLYQCDYANKACNQIILSGEGLSGIVKIFPDEKHNRIYVSDGEGHRIVVYELNSGRTIAATKNPINLHYPNNLFIANDELIVSDTFHHRLIALDPDDVNKELWSAKTTSEIGSPLRKWTTNVAKTANGHFWVINDNILLEYGDVILMDDKKQPYKRLALDSNWDPIRILARQHDVLIVSKENYDFISVNLAGDRFLSFGDEHFRKILAQKKLDYEAYHRWWSLWIWLLLGPFLILAIVAVALDTKSRKAETKK